MIRRDAGDRIELSKTHRSDLCISMYISKYPKPRFGGGADLSGLGFLPVQYPHSHHKHKGQTYVYIYT